jgi:hypothetical protein
MSAKSVPLCIAATISILLGASRVDAASGYTFTTIDFPGAYSTFPKAINNSGQVAGYYVFSSFVSGFSSPYDLTERPWHGFVFSNGQYTSIDVPGATWTEALAINDSGKVFGIYYAISNVTEGLFEYDVTTGTLTTTPPITLPENSAPNRVFSDITSMNANGVAAGWTSVSIFTYANGIETRVMDADSSTFAGALPSVGINSSGTVVTPAVIAFGGGAQAPVPSNFSVAGIGPASELVGTYTAASYTVHGALFKNGSMTFVDHPDVSFGLYPYSRTYPTAVNDSGQIVGSYYLLNGNHGFLAIPPSAAASEKTRINIDIPNSNVQASGTYMLAGWATNDTRSVNAVSIRLDGNFVGTASYGSPRPDVCAAFANQQDCPNVGWSYLLNTTGSKDGQHVLEAVAVAADGSHAIARSSFTIDNANGTSSSPIQMFIDTPSAGSTASGTITVSGWVFDPNATVSVFVIVDPDSTIGNAFYSGNFAPGGLPRPDVCAAFNYATNCANSGWSYALNTTQYSNGTHTLAAVAFNGVDSKVLKTTFKIFNNGPLHLHVDHPASNGGTVAGDLQLFGWAADDNAFITYVSYSVDGQPYYPSPRTGNGRADVCAVYPKAIDCPNVGWSGLLDTNQLSNGTHTITFSAYSSGYNPTGQILDYTSDSAVSDPITFTVNNPSSVQSTHIHIDSPTPSQVLWTTPTFSGWAVDDVSPIRRIDILIDGKVIGSTTTSQSRPDVCAAYPNRSNCPYVGWKFNPNTRFLTNGVHTLTAIASSDINSEATTSTTFNVQNADGTSATHINVDAPSSSSSALSGNTTFAGWAFNQNMTLSSLSIAVDNIQISTLGRYQFFPRLDVCAKYPDAFACPNVGWSVPFDTTSLANGVHVLKVTATSPVRFDQPATVFKMFTVSNAADSSPIKSHIDIPAANATVSGVTSFGGWAVHNTNPIASVVIYIDGVPYGPAYYGVSRGDVCAAFPNEYGCPAGNVGWAFAFDTTLIRNGTHTLQVESSSTDGAHYTISEQFKVSN